MEFKYTPVTESLVDIFVSQNHINPISTTISIANQHKLSFDQLYLLVDLIKSKFPYAAKDYVHTWARRIKQDSAYEHADGKLRAWLDQNVWYQRLKLDADVLRVVQLYNLDAVGGLKEREVEELAELESSIDWDRVSI